MSILPARIALSIYAEKSLRLLITTVLARWIPNVLMTFSVIIARRSSMVSFLEAKSFSVSDLVAFLGSPEAFLTNFLTLAFWLRSISKSGPNKPAIVSPLLYILFALIRMRSCLY